MCSIMAERLKARIYYGRALNTMTGISQVDIAFWVNTIQFGHRQLKWLVPITLITNVGQDKSLVEDLNMEWSTISVIVALRYDPLRSNPYARYLCGVFWERLFKNICLVLEPMCSPFSPTAPYSGTTIFILSSRFESWLRTLFV